MLKKGCVLDPSEYVITGNDTTKRACVNDF